jgi:hypothetical protein
MPPLRFVGCRLTKKTTKKLTKKTTTKKPA